MSIDEDHLRRLASEVHVAVLATTRPDGSVHASLVSSGVMDHPLGGGIALGAVVGGGARKLEHLRRSGRGAVTFVNGFDWVTAEGPVTLVGPDDPCETVPPESIAALLRDVFRAAGGTHENWDEYDRVMAEERRTAAFIRPERVLRNR